MPDPGVEEIPLFDWPAKDRLRRMKEVQVVRQEASHDEEGQQEEDGCCQEEC